MTISDAFAEPIEEVVTVKTEPKMPGTYRPPVSATPLVAEPRNPSGVSQYGSSPITPEKTRAITNKQEKLEDDFVMPVISEGMIVLHARFGEGKIQKIFVNEKKVTVKFEEGEKTFVIDEKSPMNAFKKGYLKIKI